MHASYVRIKNVPHTRYWYTYQKHCHVAFWRCIFLGITGILDVACMIKVRVCMVLVTWIGWLSMTQPARYLLLQATTLCHPVWSWEWRWCFHIFLFFIPFWSLSRCARRWLRTRAARWNGSTRWRTPREGCSPEELPTAGTPGWRY